ncbi:MAG: LPS export ABC transporter periplasmic protein LptC [Alphaproteobacteria bacterium]|nr:LPS export ABC transporter periplasmic protein LptC [Alphaproteobacteria bacterium]MDP6517231.1 LPS export ABC transporter periplasmic protein LptC [Alphaproteobacteria bacterium]
MTLAKRLFIQRWRAPVAGSETIRAEAGYRRRVWTLKWLLPLSALAVLVAILWSSLAPSHPSFRLDYALSDLQISGQDEIIDPRLLGTDSKRQRYTVTAEAAMRSTDDDDQIFLLMPEADVAMGGDDWMVLKAEQGIYDSAAETLKLDGDVSIYTDRGFEVHTESALLDLAAGTASGAAAVQGQGPWGLLDAVGFTYRRAGHVFRFSGQPKLVLYGTSGEG